MSREVLNSDQQQTMPKTIKKGEHLDEDILAPDSDLEDMREPSSRLTREELLEELFSRRKRPYEDIGRSDESELSDKSDEMAGSHLESGKSTFDDLPYPPESANRRLQ